VFDLRGMPDQDAARFFSFGTYDRTSVLDSGGTTFSDVRSLLESVSHLQDSPIVVVPADDLNSDRQSAFGEGTGNRDGGVPRDGDVISRLHPGDVVFHLHAGNLHRVMRLHVKR